MKKIIGIALIIAGILFASLTVKSLFSSPQAEKQIKSAITVKDGKLLPENEGKTVVVSGTLKADEPLIDNLTGVSLPGITAKRTVWTYRRVADKGDDRVWNWEPEATDFSEQANYGINAEILTSTVLTVPVSLGEFKVESRLLMPISISATFTDYDEATLKAGWNLFTGFNNSSYCISKAHQLPKKTTGGYTAWGEGVKKVTYDVVSSDDPLVYTIIGIQKGNTLIKAEDIDTVTTYKGIMSAEEFAEKSKKETLGGAIFAIVIGLAMIFIGIMLIIRRQGNAG